MGTGKKEQNSRMNIRKLAGDVAVAFLAQGLGIASSVVTTLILPKFLGVEEFGYWQLFLFYVSYLGFFHLGINDGLYLIKGGKTRDTVDKKDVNSQFAFSCSYQMVVAIVLMVIAILGPFEGQRRLVVGATAALLTITNAEFFLGYLFQALNETKLFSLSSAIESGIFFLGLIPLLALKVSSFEPYIAVYVLSKVIRLLYCLTKSKDFLTSGLYPPRTTLNNSITSIRVGIKLMLSNIVGASILGVIRFFVDVEWGIEVFSIVSFSLSIASFFLLFLTQVSMVLFPHLRQADSDSVEHFYVFLRNSLSLILPAVYLLYPLIALLLNLWVPEYSKSIELFIFLFPLCAFDGKMDIISTTYFKVLRLEGKLFIVNTIAFLASLTATIIGTFLLHSISFILASVVSILALRSLISERVIERKLGLSCSLQSLTTLVLSFLFVSLFSLCETKIAFAIFFVCYLIYLGFSRKALCSVAAAIKKR